MLLPLILAGVPVLKRRISKPKSARLLVSSLAGAKPFGPLFFVYSPIIILLFKYTPVQITMLLQLNVSPTAVFMPTILPFLVKIFVTSPCLSVKFSCSSKTRFILAWYFSLSACARRLYTAGPLPRFSILS